MQCIKGQHFNATSNKPFADTDSNVCECVYLMKNMTVNSTKPLTAMQLACYSNWT